jgi:hypothetical protein
MNIVSFFKPTKATPDSTTGSVSSVEESFHENHDIVATNTSTSVKPDYGKLISSLAVLLKLSAREAASILFIEHHEEKGPSSLSKEVPQIPPTNRSN